MRIVDNALERVFLQLTWGNAGLAITEMETYLAAWPHPQTAGKLQGLKEEYGLMERYWRQAVRDPQLDEQYLRLLQRLYVLCANVAIFRRMRTSSFLTGLYTGVRQPGRDWSVATIRGEMENFVSEAALLQLEPEHLREEKEAALYRDHQHQMTALFNYVVTSHIWTEGAGRDFEEMLVSPTLDSTDQQLIVSAVMLSLMNQFDMVKFRVLVDVYRRSRDEGVRQRALVGWVLSIDDSLLGIYPAMQELVGELLQSAKACKELTELQMQLVYTLNAEKDTNTMQQEIMPDLLKNNNIRVTRNGIEEVEDDPMEDILNPGAAEQRMERMEATIQRMMDMQKQGSDIYFGGFSQMKRFPFFYDMANWLVPFYWQHPDLQQFVKKIGTNKFMERLVEVGPFCNSDKYSLVIAFQNVFDRLPEQMRNMMKRGEAQAGDEMEPEQLQSAAYVRRVCLMDLYRFFRLFPNRAVLRNPFDMEHNDVLGDCAFFGSRLFDGTPLEAHKRDVVRFFHKQGYITEADDLLKTFPEELRDAQYYLWQGNYEAVLQVEPDNVRALAGRARQLFVQGQYAEAEDAYDRLLLLEPDKTRYRLNKAVCLLRMGEHEEALRLLYQLNYEHEDDDNINRVLAWTLTCVGRLEQAEQLYQQLAKGERPAAEDYLNHGYCLWLQGRIDEAASCFQQYVEVEQGVGTDVLFQAEEPWLQERGIGPTEVRMMRALVAA